MSPDLSHGTASGRPTRGPYWRRNSKSVVPQSNQSTLPDIVLMAASADPVHVPVLNPGIMWVRLTFRGVDTEPDSEPAPFVSSLYEPLRPVPICMMSSVMKSDDAEHPPPPM